MWRYDEELIMSAGQQEIIDAVNLLSRSPWFGYDRNFTKLLGGITRNSTGHIVAAETSQMVWSIKVGYIRPLRHPLPCFGGLYVYFCRCLTTWRLWTARAQGWSWSWQTPRAWPGRRPSSRPFSTAASQGPSPSSTPARVSGTSAPGQSSSTPG